MLALLARGEGVKAYFINDILYTVGCKKSAYFIDTDGIIFNLNILMLSADTEFLIMNLKTCCLVKRQKPISD